jgi:ankyrin repeat protein
MAGIPALWRLDVPLDRRDTLTDRLRRGTTMTFRSALTALLLCAALSLSPALAGTDIPLFADTPLSDAASEGDVQGVEHALIGGKDPNGGDLHGTPAIIFAAVGGHDDVIKALLGHGANIDAPDQYGNTALLEAAVRGRTATVRTLLAAGAKVDWQNRAGESALIRAARAGQATVVETLIAAKADLEATDFAGRTALNYATEAHFLRVAGLLQKAGAKP